LALHTVFTELRVTRRGQLVTEEQWQRGRSRRLPAVQADVRQLEPSRRELGVVGRAEIEEFARRLRAG
jgi:hypothetical protein